MLTSLHLWLHVTTIAIVVLNCGLRAVVAVALSTLLMIALLLVHCMDRRGHRLGFHFRLWVGSLFQVFLLVVVQVAGCREGVATSFTLVGLLSRMYPFMDFQIWLFGEVFPAVGTVELNGLFMVLFDVPLQITSACELNPTMVALSLKFP